MDYRNGFNDELNGESDGNTSFLRAARAGHLDKVLEHLKSNIDINTSNANGLNALHLSSKDGHVTVVEELLRRGALVDSATKKGNTALHIASLAGQEEVVKLLVLHGATVNVQSQNGFTPLYMAAQENHDNVVRFLLANGANQTLATEDGFTPLAVAMQQGHDKVVTVLLESDTRGKVRLPALHIAAKKDDCKAAKLLLENEHNPDVTSKSGFTPLHIASHYGNDAIGHLLIQKGADANYSAKHNITPLHVAAKWGKTNMVALLLERGATIEAKTRDGLTPLHCAARSGHEQVVDMLVERGAPISCKTKNGLAPLHMAAQGDHVDAARILLYHRAPVDEVTVDYLTALHVAAHCGHVRVAKLLLDRQADANARALNGFTPLHIACKKNRIKVVELLLKHGASIGATTESGLTPLHVASFMGCMNIVIYLLQHDANPDVPTVRGETPLHLAARANQTDIIRILLRNGAQVDARAREQQTPLHIASRLGNVDIVMLLLQHGAKVDTATKDMYTALHIAAKEGQDEVAAVLIDNGASLNATTKKGFTPLHLSAKYGQIKVAKLLLQKEASVDNQGKNGVTPLHVAAHYDHQNVALLLLDKGASPHASAKNGHTPLHIAAKKNQMDIASTLLEYGARPSAESKAGFTPLHLSAQEGHTDMSALLVEHQADVNQQSKNGLTPLHLCAQEDRVPVAEMLVRNGANIESTTKAGFTPLHVAAHYGQANMVRFLLGQRADVQATTSIGYTPLHQAAQQGHSSIVNILLEGGAEPNSTTYTGQTPLGIAQRLGYVNVIETLKVITTTTTTASTTEEKYKVIAPEAMQETFMSDSEEEGGEDTMLGDNAYRYLTADEMKSLGDDSLPIDVTRDERIDSNKMALSGDAISMPPQAFEDSLSPQHYQPISAEYNNTKRYTADNVDIARRPINIGFLVSFLVDARGGAMRGCRHSGVRVIVPPRSASSPTRITCRYVRPQRTPHPPPLMEGEALASRVLELGPVGSRFLGPVIIEVPHFAALRGKEREIVILRSDNGETWREHNIDQAEDILNDVLNDSFEADDLSQMEDTASGRITRILTHDFPQYFAVVSRVRQEVHAIGPEGGMVSSTVVPQVQAVFPPGALTKKIKVGLQAQPIDPELTAKLLGHGVAVSPVVTVEPRRRKFHKAITLSMPAPRAHSQGMINQYSGSAPTLRLLCSITGGTTRAQWEDVTGSTPLTFVNECVSFTTTVSARFWLMDCRNIQDAAKMATELYREAIHVPFMAKFVVFAKRVDTLEARLRVFCMTDDKEDKTLEHQEHFTEIAKSRDVEVLEGKPQYIEFAGNLIPITKSGEQLQFAFRAFRENRLPFSVRVKDQHAEAIGRSMFMKEPKVAKGEPPQQPICILNIVLPEDIVADTISLTEMDSSRRLEFLKDGYESYRPDPRISDMSNLLGDDWVTLANQLGLTTSEINVIKSEYPDSVAKQAQSMLRMWIAQSGNRAQSNILEVALRKIGREEIIPQCLTIDPAAIERVTRPMERLQETPKFRVKKETSQEEKDMMKDSESVESLIREDKSKKRESFDKYSAEEKFVEEPSEEEEEDFNVTVTERRVQIEQRLSQERQIPASSQRVEIVQEISSIKRQSLVEDKIMQVEKTITDDVKPPMPSSDSSQSIKATSTVSTTSATISTVTVTGIAAPTDAENLEVDREEAAEKLRKIEVTDASIVEVHKHKPDYEEMYDNDKSQKNLMEAVSHELTVSVDKHKTDDSLQILSRTPPPSPADFLLREQSAVLEEQAEVKRPIVEQARQEIEQADNKEESCYKQLTLASEPSSLTPTPKPRSTKPPETSIDSPSIEPMQLVDINESNIQSETGSVLVSGSSVESEPENYNDRKKFWESKEQQDQIMGIKKRFSLHEDSSADIIKIVDKRKSIHEVSLDAPTPKPRSTASIDRGRSDIFEEDIHMPPVTEYQAQFKDHAVTTSTVQEPKAQYTLEKDNSTDSDIECSGQFNISSGYDNTGYISDSGDVEHYISDSEIEDRVPQIRERQMSVFQPSVTAGKSICARSASLPTEDMYEVSADSIKLRKQYYEEQIKKEMVEDQMMTEIEEEDISLQEHKTLEVKRDLHEPSGIKSVPETTSHESEYDVLSKSKTEIESKLEQMYKKEMKDEAIFLESDRIESASDIVSESAISFQERTVEDDHNHKEDSIQEISFDNVFQIRSDVSKPSDSLEVHVDKSEIEDSEKMTDLDQDDAIDIDTKSLDSTELSPKTLFNSDITPSSNVETKVLSPIRQSVENIQATVWEAPIIHAQGTFDEKAVDIIIEKAPGHERDDELSVGTREESDLGSEIHQDHSDSYSSDRIKSESHDIEKLILESLHHQKISPEEAQIIANELIADIELEIQRRHSIPADVVEPPAPEYAKNQISEYLQHLAEAKGLDSREIELVQSVLARKHRELAKLSREDTQASSMEITDEELRYSGADYSPSGSRFNILEEQIDQLKAERVSDVDLKSFEMKTEKSTSITESTKTIVEEDESVIDISLDDKTKIEVAAVISKTARQPAEDVEPLKIEIKRGVEFHIGDEKIIIEKQDEQKSASAAKEVSTVISERTVTTGFDFSPITSPVKSATGDASSDPEPALRKKMSDVDTSSSSSKKSHRKSGLEVDTCSSSGESHYHSFEVDSGKSRPCSSDVDVLIAAGSSEYESALASQETSTKSHITSAEYVTAVSSISSKESMKSLDSESSGNLASVEVSEASETLVPSELEYNDDIQKKSASKAHALIQRQTTDESEFDIELRDSPDISEEELLDDKNIEELSTKMKRSHEMNFPSETRAQQVDQSGTDDKLGTSLDDGSVLSVSLSSTSSLAQTRTTIIENIHSNQQSFGSLASLEDITGRSEAIGNQQSPAMSAANLLSVSTKTLDDDTSYDSVTLITSSVEHEGIQSVSTQVTSTIDTKPENQKIPECKVSETVVETKKKCHRRNESTSNFTPERIIYPKDKEFVLETPQTSATCKQKTEESDIAIELKKKFTPDVIDKHRLDKRDSHTKSSTTSSERSSFEEAEAEAAFSMVAHISPVHKIKQICPIIEDETAEINELEAREEAEREIEKNRALNKESAAFIPDIKVTQHMAPMERDGFRYPDLEIEEKDDESQNTTPQTPASISSKSSDSTDQGREYILDDSRMSIIDESEGSQSVDDKMVESKSEAATIIEKTICETDKETESPGSDSFELVEKPDIIDDFVVIEEVAKEAQETDSEGKSLKIAKQKHTKKHDTDMEQYLVKTASKPSNKPTGVQYYPQAQQRTEELGFEFEESPPQADAKEQQTKYVQEFDKELEENKKWIEQQFLGDQASMMAAGYGYEMDFERGPLEDIKEEDATDFDSSRIGSLSSHKESGGSLGSVKDSYSSTPEYDVLAGRKYFTKSGENDDVSMSSLQEFENLERAMSLENRKFHQGSNSSSNGSFKNRYAGRGGAGDDVSVSSLKEFEGLEKACIAAHTIEQKVQEEEAMLSHIEECQESIISETESCETFSGTDKKLIPDSDEEDYEKRMFEIDEIIRQAQTNVEHFVDFKEGERTESIGRGDSVEEVSKVPDLDLDLPIKRIPTKPPAPSETEDVMVQSTDSLDVKVEKQLRYNSSDSLDAEQKTAADLMTDSTDSIELNARKLAHGTFSSDSIEARIVESDSLDLAAAAAQTVTQLSDSIDEDGSRIIYYDHSTASTGKTYSSSAKENIPAWSDTKGTTEFMLESCDSIASTSTATYAHRHESESIYSGSCTSGDSNTMVSSTDTIDPIMSVSAEVADASTGTRRIWFDEDAAGAGKMYTTEYYDDSARSRITETIEQEPEGSIYSHTVKRTVEMPPQIVKMTFTGSDAQSQLERYMESLAPAESVEESEEIDADGNVHIKRIVKKTMIVTDTKALPEGQGVISRTLTDEHGSKTIFTQAFELGNLDQTVNQKSTTGTVSSQGESSQAVRSEQELQTENQSQSQTNSRQVKDQQELSQEMKDILKALEEDSYK